MNASIDELAERAGIEPAFRDYFGNETIVSEATKRALLEAMRFETCHPGASTSPGLRSLRELGDKEAETCYLPPEMQNGRIWALATQLYGLRSQRNWGIGDFTDLGRLAKCAGDAGARAIALNPLHELHPSNPEANSPYSPSSRLWLNPIYVDVTRVADFAESQDARTLFESRAFASKLAELRDSGTVRYGDVARAKHRMLELLFASFRINHLERPGDRRASAFRSFLREGGSSLVRLARYESLTEFFRERDERSFGWLQWPSEFRSPESPAVERFAARHRDRIDFFAYLQWIADEQLAGCARGCAADGVVLYRDLAVGVDRNSADAWSDPQTILEAVSLGAPPDALNAHGQRWGLPPLSPQTLLQRGFAPFAQLLRANMRHAGILRIDHVMALRRAFWIPQGRPPSEGAYVNYPFDAMLETVARESAGARCAVVGEDLGTVPEGFRERINGAGILSSRLVYFERSYPGGAFALPPSYPRLAAASIGTHDLPPLAGWWSGSDIELRARLGLLGGREAIAAIAQERARARLQLIDALQQAGAADPATAALLREDAHAGGTAAAAPSLSLAVHRFLAQTLSMLAVVAIEDVLGEIEAVNVPGTLDEHPNWRRKHIATLEEIERDGRLMQIGRIFEA